MGPLFAGAFMPLDFVSSVAVSTLLTGALSALAYWKGVLTWDGSLAAFVVGMVIGIFGDVTWLFLLLFFLLSSFLATRYRFALKEALGVQEGTRGERRAANVLANGAAPMFVAAVSIVMPAVVGFLGCQLDSVIGATLEQRGLVSKKVNNLMSTSAGAMLAYAVLISLGPLPAA